MLNLNLTEISTAELIVELQVSSLVSSSFYGGGETMKNEISNEMLRLADIGTGGSSQEPTYRYRIKSVKVKNLQSRVILINFYICEGKKDVQIRQIVASIINRRCGNDWYITPKNWEGEVRAIFDYIRSNVRYTLDPYNLELFQRACCSLELKIGDCDDFVILAGAMLQTIGYPLKIVCVDTSDNGFDHVYLRVGLPPTGPTEWISFDLTATDEDLGWESPGTKKVFEVRDEDLIFPM
jgi:transglutaminase-like putative cysteine protease